MQSVALEHAKEQLEYWKAECEKAWRLQDEDRIKEAERFRAQLENVVTALTLGAKEATKASTGSRF